MTPKNRLPWLTCAPLIALLLAPPAASRADLVSSVQVTFDTSNFAPNTPAQLYFQFTADGGTTDSATVSLGNYSVSNATSDPSSAMADGAGNIANPGAGTINGLGLSVGNDFHSDPNDVYFNLTFGSTSAQQDVMQFTLTFSGPAVNTNDAGYTYLQVQLVDPTNNYSSLTGGSDLIDVTLKDSSTDALAASSNVSGVTFTSFAPSQAPTGTPEPSTLVAGCVCAAVLCLAHRRRARRMARVETPAA